MNPLTPEIEFCRATVKAWERLRLIYNAILLVAGGAVLWRTLAVQGRSGSEEMLAAGYVLYQFGHPLELVAYSFIFGLVANICYCLGPYLEFVITTLGFPVSGQRSRLLLFVLGVFLSLCVVSMAWIYVEAYADDGFLFSNPGP